MAVPRRNVIRCLAAILLLSATLLTAPGARAALTLNATDSVWFVLNDQYWDDYYTRQNTRDSERIVDFRYLGDSQAGNGKDSKA